MTIRCSLLMTFLLSASVFSGPDQPASRSVPIYSRILDCNHILLGLNNIGTLWNGDFSTASSAVWYSPEDSFNTVIVYDQGFWVIGKVHGVRREA